MSTKKPPREAELGTIAEGSRTRTDERGYKYTTLSDRDDLVGLNWDSEMLNWTLFEMAVRLGLVQRTKDDSAKVDVVIENLVENFFDKFDEYESRLEDDRWVQET